MIYTIVLIFILLAFFAFAFEALARKTKISSVLIRKLIHVSMSLVMIAIACLFGYRYLIIIGMGLTIAFILSRKFYRLRCLRDRSDQSWGEITFPLGIAVSAIISVNQNIFIASMLVLAFSDTIAFVIGRHFRKAPKIIGDRTIAGSGAGFVTSLVILISLGFGVYCSLITAFAIFIAELFSKKGFDNLTMPVVAAIILSVLI